MKQLQFYKTGTGSAPFAEWLDGLEDLPRAKIMAFLKRVALGGSKKNIKPVGKGVFEIKINYGPGYRVYFGMIGNVIILLLLGGNKGDQDRDIHLAQMYWRSFYVQK